MAKDAAGNEIPEGGNPPNVEPVQPKLEDVLKQLADMKAAGDKRDKEFQALQEQNQALLAQRQPAPAPTSADGGEIKLSKDFAQLYNMPAELARDLVAEAVRIGEEKVIRHITRVEQERDIRTSFYEKNVDLKKHATVVAAMADAVQKENPNMPLVQAMDKVAERTREYLKSVRTEVQPASPEIPPVLGAGSGGEPPKPPAGGPKPLTPDEELEEYIKSRRGQPR
jgi:hypothetical protein